MDRWCVSVLNEADVVAYRRSFISRQTNGPYLSVFSLSSQQALMLPVPGQSRFFRMHGQHEACLDRTKSQYKKPQRRSHPIIFGLFSLLLFDAPHACMSELEAVYVDNSVVDYAWHHYIKKRQEDWTNAMIPVRLIQRQ